MHGDRIRVALGVALAATAWPSMAMAQTTDELLGMSVGQLRGEMTSRYEAALAMTRDAAIVSANNPQYLWAAQAKAQCGIALGFLKNNTKDAVSVGKCVDAANRMRMVPPPPFVPLETPKIPEICSQPIAGIVFFEWDSDVPPESAVQTLNGVVANQKMCEWGSLAVTGHTDRSGSDAYNDALSMRRANAVANLLDSMGMPRSVLAVTGRGEAEPKVPTADGERNPSNRRVEITVR